MELLSKEVQVKFQYMGLEDRRRVASWLLSDQVDHLDYPEDLDRIQGVLHEEGYSFTYQEIQKIWRNLSQIHEQDWMELPRYDGTILTIFETQGDLLDEHER